MPYYLQMRLRSVSRLVSLLLLFLAAFGTPASGSSFVILRCAEVIVCAGDLQPAPRQTISTPPAPPVPAHTIRLNLPRTDPQWREVSFWRVRFQRPPPFLFCFL
jgi:hypothetical protein